MSTHAKEHEDLVQAVVAGDLAETSPEVVRRVSECAVCAAQIARLRAVAARLDAEAREELAILALAERITDAPGLDREALRRGSEVLRGSAPRGLRRRALAWAGAGAAAAALMLFLYVRAAGPATEDPGRGGPDQMLGDEPLRLLPFDGFGDDLELRFEASSAIQGDVATWKLRVEGVAADGSPFDRMIPDATNPWSDPAQAREFPDEITVTVLALNASGDTIARSEPVSGRRAR